MLGALFELTAPRTSMVHVESYQTGRPKEETGHSKADTRTIYTGRERIQFFPDVWVQCGVCKLLLGTADFASYNVDTGITKRSASGAIFQDDCHCGCRPVMLVRIQSHVLAQPTNETYLLLCPAYIDSFGPARPGHGLRNPHSLPPAAQCNVIQWPVSEAHMHC